MRICHSQNKPFCSGMHTPTVFEWAGGLPALTRMTRIFYEKYAPNDDLLAPLFAAWPKERIEVFAR
jgi:truncated hemoglobin YjbI